MGGMVTVGNGQSQGRALRPRGGGGGGRRPSTGAAYGGGPVAVGSTGDPGLDMLNFSMPAGTEFGEVNMGGGQYSLIGPGGRTFVGGGGGGVSQGDALRSRNQFMNPDDAVANTPYDPGQTYAFDRAADFERGLADQTNEETVRELQRARDDISVGMRAEGEAAIGRGADPSLFRTRALEAGKRDLHSLQGKLADVSLGRRQGAINSVTAAAGARADSQRAMHLGTQAHRLAEDRFHLDAAESQARLNEMPYERMLKMMDIVSRGGGFMGGGGGGGGGFIGGRRGKVGFGAGRF